MDKTNEPSEPTKKCFCARCFLPIDPEDKVDVEGQNFHRTCSMCCICRTIPTSIKMFYGNVFCNECFKTHVLNKFRGEPMRMHSNSWWMQWAPGMRPQGPDGKPVDKEDDIKEEAEKETEQNDSPMPKCCPEEPCKKCICARCLQAVDMNNKVDIGGQSFHPQCARCYFCHCVPTDNVKIYYGQVFCEECFHKFVMARNRDTPQEHFRACFEHWQNNGQFAENMREFMSGKETSPIVFMMQGAHPPFCRCGGHAHAHAQRDWCQNEPRKSATPASLSVGGSSFGTCDLSFENRTEVSDQESRSRESANQENLIMAAAAEKIEKLTKYLQDTYSDSEKCSKKWKNFVEFDKPSISEADQCLGWIDLQDPKVVKNGVGCPKCLWQCGPIFVNSEHFQNEVVCCGEYEY